MTAQDLKNSILQLAVHGKLVPQDPSDEPVDLKGLKLKNTDECEFDIPYGWRLAHLESISNGVPSKQYQILESEVKHSGKYFVISQSKAYSIGFTDNVEKVYSHKQPVVVFGDHTTEVKYLDFDFVVGADGVKIFEPVYRVITPKFLFYVLQFYSIGLSKVGGYSRHYKFIKNKPIPLPPLAEQQRIVAKIEELMPLVEEYGKAEEQIKALNAEFPDKLRKSILQQAVQGKLTERDPSDEPASELLKRIRAEKAKLIAEGKIKKEKPLPAITDEEKPFDIPDTWEWSSINELFWVTKLAGFEYTKYFAKDQIASQNTVRIVRAQNVKMNRFVENENEAITEELSVLLERSALTVDCLLMTFIGAGIGDTCIYSSPYRHHLAPNVAKIVPVTEGIYLRYYLIWLMSPAGQASVEKIKKSTAQPSLSMETIRSIRVAVPPLAEQKRIVARVEKLLAACDGLK